MTRKLLLLFLVSITLFCSAERVAILADYDIEDMPITWDFLKEHGYEPELVSFANFKDYATNKYDSDVKKILMMNQYVSNKPEYLSLLPKEKLVLFVWEPVNVPDAYYRGVSKVYTYNDKLLDKRHFFKFYYPYARPMITDRPRFNEKKFSTMVTRHWVPGRCKVVEFFSNKNSSDFEFYGSDPGEYANSPLYKGKIPGTHSGMEKTEVLKNYKFCFCFENNVSFPGYITEKIFACFAAGCVPIYLGPTNAEHYIPENCYVDYRAFPSLDALYHYLKSMPESRHERYIADIQAFLESSSSYIFSPDYFQEVILHAVNE